MISIPRLSSQLRQILETDANELAHAHGVIQRKRVFTGASLVQLLDFGWLKEPHAGSSALARFAGGLGLKVSKQGIEERWTMQTATWLEAVLGRGVQCLVSAQAVSIPLLRRFPAVLLEDGSTITLPASLKQSWRGCGGSGPEAALKLTVRWDLVTGGLQGPYLQEGRRHETQSPLREQPMPRGSLWVGDLGYFSLLWVGQLVCQGVYFVLGYKDPLTVWNAHGKRVDVLDLVTTDGPEVLDVPVALGTRKQVQARLIAKQMPEAVVQRRRDHLKDYAHKHCKPINQRQWDLAPWAIMLTNAPSSLLCADEVMVLTRARWQVELLWKLWKQWGAIDEWQTANPARILCELYAKLLGMLVQHWLLLLSCWEDPHRSLVGAAQVIRDQVPTLVHGFTGRLSLRKALTLVKQALGNGCSIPKRQTRLNTSRLLLKHSDDGLT